MTDYNYRKRHRTVESDCDLESKNYDITIKKFDFSSIMACIENLSSRDDYTKIEVILKSIDTKLNKLDDIDKLEILIKKLEKKFEDVIREKDYEISNLKEEMDNLKVKLRDDVMELKNLNDYYT